MLNKTVLIVCKLAQRLPNIEADYIGVDKGSSFLASQKIMMEVSVGDFDSVDPSEIEQIEKYSIRCIQLPSVKDESDSEKAIAIAKELGYEKMILLGGLGKRFDHSYVNMRLLIKEKGRVSLMDTHNYVQYLEKGEYTIEKHGYQYLSFFPIKDTVVSIYNVKYPLERRLITVQDTFTLSNEIVSDKCHLIVHQGAILLMQTND